jgi:NADH-quinone oxidoreductase subunit J
MQYAFYIASLIGAVGLWLTLPSRRSRPRVLGGLIALAALIGLLTGLAGGPATGTSLYYYLFTGIAAIAAVKVISHPRPVYSALYFVLVVLSVTGLLLTLEAEFMAFATVIIYAGAILVTYVFVIMLATLPQSRDEPETAPEYDRQARDPFAAAVLGFALLAVLGNIIFAPVEDPALRITRRPAAGDLQVIATQLPGRAVPLLEEVLADSSKYPSFDAQRKIIDIEPRSLRGDAAPEVLSVKLDDGSTLMVDLDGEVAEQLSARLYNIDRVGLNLFESHVLGVELAAVVLLLSMVGAIVIARQPVPDAVPAMAEEAGG